MIGGLHDVQLPGGVQAEAIFHLWLVMLAVCALVFVAVMAALGLALWRAPRATRATPADVSSLMQAEPTVARPVIAGLIVAVVLLVGLLGASVFTDRAIARMPLANAPLTFPAYIGIACWIEGLTGSSAGATPEDAIDYDACEFARNPVDYSIQ
jgi:hypothetical protein